MATMKSVITNFFKRNRLSDCGKVAVAVSGGVDSMSLLKLVSDWGKIMGVKVIGLTVDHKLRAESGDEALMVKGWCRDNGIEHFTLVWDGEKPSTSLEEKAREARYDLMINFCKEHKIPIILTAHQADDQIETFLMNLARGSGIYGLAGMQELRVFKDLLIGRPLLNTFRSELDKFASENNLPTAFDYMNDDQSYIRVKIRKNRQCLNDLLGISDERILLAVNNLSRVRESIEYTIDRVINSLEIADSRVTFNSKILLDLPEEVRLRMIGNLIKQIGKLEYSPRLSAVKKVLDMILTDTDDATTLGGCYIRRMRGRILITLDNGKKSFKNNKTKEN